MWKFDCGILNSMLIIPIEWMMDDLNVFVQIILKFIPQFCI